MPDGPGEPVTSDGPAAPLTGWRWMFQSRRTGRLGIVAWPNPPLWTWLATMVARRLPGVHGRTEQAVVLLGTAALVVWAFDELWRGEDPWRRLLGLAVLVGLAVSAAR
jgi:hypothetical protein